MLSELEKEQLTELLSYLDADDLKTLTKTVTNALLVPEDFDEAVSTILQYSPTMQSLLSRKKITKEVVFKYLHKKKVPGADPSMTKTGMLMLINRFWEREKVKRQRSPEREAAAVPPKKVPAQQTPPARKVTIVNYLTSTETKPQIRQDQNVKPRADLKVTKDHKEEAAGKTKILQHVSPDKRVVTIAQNKQKAGDDRQKSPSKEPQPQIEHQIVPIKIVDDDDDEELVGIESLNKSKISSTSRGFDLQLFSETFTTWFYNLLNTGDAGTDQKFGPEHFWPDNILQIKVTGPNLNVQQERHSAQDSATLLSQLRSQFDLYLNPNISREGVVAQSESHGVVRITVCGTAHKRDLCVGFFEQSFMIIKDPSMQNNWRIKKTEMQMKTTIDGESGRAETSAVSLVPLLH